MCVGTYVLLFGDIVCVLVHSLHGYMIHRIWFFGNPKLYDTFIDEGLNKLLRDAAARAHMVTFHTRILKMIALHGACVDGSLFHGSNDLFDDDYGEDWCVV